ncbi:protein NLP6-like isoform X2 [Bidens hawaiensis]|uniref:protein NLP6-like isoform X2 n=1 Tax=Bidens hawaiensis TaxID=980011 RepID=UPI00404935C4
MIWNKISLEQPSVQFSDESRYLTCLWVSGTEEPSDEPCQSDSSQSITTSIGFEFRSENLFSYYQEIPYKLRCALKILMFREQHVIVQFWSPRVVGKHQLLTTIDQPFGLGVVSEELCFYRRDSEHKAFLVDKDHEEEDTSPPARVFRRGLPEWTSDLTNYHTKDFPQQDCAIRCNLHGYLALPVFDPTTGFCVGVLEILTSVKYTSYAFEVQRVHKALKAGNLASPQVFENPTSKILNEHKQNKLVKILGILKAVCDIHSLPLAQTWTVSPSSTFVSNNKVIEKACSSFDTRCIGKVCMSSSGLPFHVRDLGMWQFREACGEQHLDKARGFVGKALVARGSYYCQDVTELSEEEYPLVHYARMSRLTGCFTIFLHSVEGDGDNDDDYVLEFFLRVDNKDGRYLLNLVKTLKQNVEFGSGFELGEISPLAVIEIPKDVSYLSPSIKPHTVQISSTEMANTLMDSSDSKSILANVAKTDSANHTNEEGCIVTNNSSVQKMRMKLSRRRKKDSLTLETVEQHIGKSLGQTAEILGGNRSTLKRFCRKHGISSWPVPRHNKSNDFVNNPKLSQEPPLQQSSSTCFAKPDSIYKVARVIMGLKRWRHKSLNKGSYRAARSVGRVLDTGLLTVKASYKDDMIKFWFPVSGGLMELEKEVAERMNVKGQRLSLKYEDEEKDWVLISCDTDLEFLASNTTIRLRVELADNDY